MAPTHMNASSPAVSDPLPAITLNNNQRRYFEVLFSRLEEALAKIERLLDDPRPVQTLTLLENDVPESFRSQVREELPRIRAHVASLVAALEISPHRVSLKRTIAATLTAESIRLEDSSASHLRGYGKVDSSVGEVLDPALRALGQSLQRMAAGLRK